MLGRGTNSSVYFILLLLTGIVIGGFLGEYIGQMAYMSWLSFGYTFGINPPFTLDLGILVLSLGLTMKLNIASIIGMIISIIIYKKL